jgi:hypothetical protein
MPDVYVARHLRGRDHLPHELVEAWVRLEQRIPPASAAEDVRLDARRQYSLKLFPGYPCADDSFRAFAAA